MNTQAATQAAIVFGEGSAAVFLISQLVKRGERVIWASGSGARLMPVMPFVKSDLALGTLRDAQTLLSDQIYAQPVKSGVLHRIFRNKGFKLPTWKRVSNRASEVQAFQEMVWAPEQAYLGVEEFKIEDLQAAARLFEKSSQK